MQTTGETPDAIIGENEKLLEDILNANSSLKDKYWIVIFAKPGRGHVDGKPTLIQHIKPYKQKPTSQVGQIVAEVDNQLGTITWEINMPDVPFDYNGLPNVKHISGGTTIVETTTLGKSYVYSAAD